MSDLTITYAEIMDALADAGRGSNPDNAVTVRELVATTQLSKSAVFEALHRLLDAGRLNVVRVRRVDLSGRWSSVPAYSIKAPAKTGKKKK